MKLKIKILIFLLLFLQQFSFPQGWEADSLQQSFISIYKEMIDSNISDEKLNNIVDSLFHSPVTQDKNIISRIEDYLSETANIEERHYTIVEGDCLWTIAEKQTGDPYNWNKIYEVNDNLIKNPDLVFPNQEIKILLVNKAVNPDSVVSRVLAALLLPEENITVNNEIKDSVNNDFLEIENFIVDETLSKIGKDFFDLFYTRWEQQVSGVGSYSIVIAEKTLPQRGTHISIKVNDLDIYQSFIQPRYELIEQSVDEGIYMVYSYLQNYQAIQNELEKGDMKGTGIY
ncbi:MAG: LysM peptidoglycan-binding domain-containing protein [Ignavibacteriales bacterium]|nr:MAG: LysM peptidoglycan-binding domain-containing protein [Ignavibacteriales bacterium]